MENTEVHTMVKKKKKEYKNIIEGKVNVAIPKIHLIKETWSQNTSMKLFLKNIMKSSWKKMKQYLE